ASKARKILIDHHLHPSDFCSIIISHPEISSASEIVFRFICRLGGFDDISFEAAECIYCGMMTDTGSFTYNSNNPEIYYIISELMSKGIDKDAIYRRVYNTYSEGRLRLQGYVLYCKMKLFHEYNAALISLDREEQKRFHYNKGDTEGLVNIPLSVKGIIFSAFLREDTEKDMVKISLRSVGSFPCNQIASEYFGGGGHLNASGGEFYGPLKDAENILKQALVKYKELLNKK
ncbi:MAG: bifunctional oligoribonuclease/PAP phosphatase NrnA, partial [Phocaeicola sp.]|nr:bifunctional oligoribonuclease/PAP phosphatase NrnA [Phocaeicola sp.]